MFCKRHYQTSWKKRVQLHENTSLVIVEVCQREDNCRNVGILFKVKVATGFSKQASSNAGLKIPESWLKLVLNVNKNTNKK